MTRLHLLPTQSCLATSPLLRPQGPPPSQPLSSLLFSLHAPSLPASLLLSPRRPFVRFLEPAEYMLHREEYRLQAEEKAAARQSARQRAKLRKSNKAGKEEAEEEGHVQVSGKQEGRRARRGWRSPS